MPARRTLAGQASARSRRLAGRSAGTRFGHIGSAHGDAELDLGVLVPFRVSDPGAGRPPVFGVPCIRAFGLGSLEGSTLEASKMGEVYVVINADVVFGNIRTAKVTA